MNIWGIATIFFDLLQKPIFFDLLNLFWPYTERGISRMLVALVIGLAYLVFLLVKSIPAFIKYLVKSYREISRTLKD